MICSVYKWFAYILCLERSACNCILPLMIYLSILLYYIRKNFLEVTRPCFIRRNWATSVSCQFLPCPNDPASGPGLTMTCKVIPCLLCVCVCCLLWFSTCDWYFLFNMFGIIIWAWFCAIEYVRIMYYRVSHIIFPSNC